MPHDSPMNLVTKDHGEIRTGSPPTGATNAGGLTWWSGLKFQRKTHYNSKMVQDRRIVSITVEWDVISALSNGDVTDDLG